MKVAQTYHSFIQSVHFCVTAAVVTILLRLTIVIHGRIVHQLAVSFCTSHVHVTLYLLSEVKET